MCTQRSTSLPGETNRPKLPLHIPQPHCRPGTSETKAWEPSELGPVNHFNTFNSRGSPKVGQLHLCLIFAALLSNTHSKLWEMIMTWDKHCRSRRLSTNYLRLPTRDQSLNQVEDTFARRAKTRQCLVCTHNNRSPMLQAAIYRREFLRPTSRKPRRKMRLGT